MPALNFRIVSAAIGATFLLMLSSCSSGGSSSPPATTTPATTPQPYSGDITPLVAALTFPIISPPTSNPADDAEYSARKQAYETDAEHWKYWLLQTNFGIILQGTDNHHDLIKSSAAYARGATGAGEIIYITDSGIRETHREFGFGTTDKVIKTTEDDYSPTDSDKGHGTAVAAIIAANRHPGSQNSILGVAFDAKILFREISLGTGDGIYRPLDLSTRDEADDMSDAAFFAAEIKRARDGGAAIINQSFGIAGAIDDYDADDIRRYFHHMGRALAQPDIDAADKTIIVWAAGNAAGQRLGTADGPVVTPTSVEIWSGLGAYIHDLQPHVLAVVSVDQAGVLSSFSNPCGIAKTFCLAAPGSSIYTAASGSDLQYRTSFSGTSAAAPVVSGSLALLRQYFRGQLGNTEVVRRLLATANRTGIYADSDIYGHGLVDLDAATAPAGALMTGLPGDANAKVFAPGSFSLSGGAFGGAFESGLAQIEVAAFDQLGAPFFFFMDGHVSQAPQTSGNVREHKVTLATETRAGFSLHTEGAEFTGAHLGRGDWWIAYGHHGGREAGVYLKDSGDGGVNGTDINQNIRGINGGEHAHYMTPPGATALQFNEPLAFASPYLSLVRDGPGFGWSRAFRDGARFGFSLMHGAPQFDHLANPGGDRGFGALFDYRPRGAAFSWQSGYVMETDGFLGARPGGDLGRANADTAFAGIGGDWPARNHWRVLASAYLGHTRAETSGGTLQDSGAIVSSAFSLGAARASVARRGDWLGLRLSQPLRTESGVTTLRLPSGRTKYGEVVHREHEIGLTPSGRNVQAEATYRMPFFGGHIESSLGVEQHPQHDSARDPDGFMRFSFLRRF